MVVKNAETLVLHGLTNVNTDVVALAVNGFTLAKGWIPTSHLSRHLSGYPASQDCGAGFDEADAGSTGRAGRPESLAGVLPCRCLAITSNWTRSCSRRGSCWQVSQGLRSSAFSLVSRRCCETRYSQSYPGLMSWPQTTALRAGDQRWPMFGQPGAMGNSVQGHGGR